MSKRKKYPKLPNGYGSIRYLGKNRRNPYAVHPPTETFTLEGVPERPAALCYVDSWLKGFAVLTSYKAGTYTPGDERIIEIDNNDDVESVVKKIISDYSIAQRINIQESKNPTFKEVYKDFFKYKFESENSKKYSKSTISSTKVAFNNCSSLHDRIFKDLRFVDLQKVVDDCPLKHASLELIVSLYHQMYAYADIRELVDKDYSAHVKISKPDDDINGIPFTENDLKILWANKNDPTVELILIMCYSGYRISAYRSLHIDINKMFFKGGVKTTAGKDRIVPIHSAILPLVKKRIKQSDCLLRNEYAFRESMYKILNELKIDRHTPHDCRHTFSMLCEKYNVNENDRKRMLGHSFGQDITNGIYGHRDLEDLRNEIEKIKICD